MNKKIISTLIIILFLATGIVPICNGFSKDINIIHDNEKLQFIDSSQIEDKKILGLSQDVDWWSMFHHDPQLTGFSTSFAPNTNHILWTYSSGIYFDGFCSPAIVDDRLYIGSSSFALFQKDAIGPIDYILREKSIIQNYDHLLINNPDELENSLEQYFGIFYCLNAVNGVELWTFYTDGNSISSPAVANNRVYISAFNDYELTGKVYCLDATTGDEIWNNFLFSPYSSPVVMNDRLYISTIEIQEDDFIGKIFCLNSFNGNEIWNYTIGIGEYLLLSTPAVAYGNIYFITENDSEGGSDHIFCLDANSGELIWQSSILSMLNSPVISYGNVYLSSYDVSNNRGTFLCLDAEDGEEKWCYMMGINELPGYSSPAVAYGNVYFVTLDAVSYRAKIFCINASTGGYVWARTPGDMMFLSSPAIADEKLYIASAYFDPNLYCFDSNNGVTIWSYPLYFGILSSPAIAKDTLFIADGSWTVYAFQDENRRPESPNIAGPLHGKIGNKYDYSFVSIDPDGHDLYYYIDWGDGSFIDWFGPYDSNEKVVKGHRWFKQGDFSIKAKAKDVLGAESDWSELIVIMPRNKLITSLLLLRFLERYPLLQTLLMRLGLQ